MDDIDSIEKWLGTEEVIEIKNAYENMNTNNSTS